MYEYIVQAYTNDVVVFWGGRLGYRILSLSLPFSSACGKEE